MVLAVSTTSGVGVGHGGLLGRGGGGDVVEVRVEGTVKHRLSGLNHSMGWGGERSGGEWRRWGEGRGWR